MEKDHFHSSFQRSLMAGLFAGLVATTLSLFYNVLFREITHFPLIPFVNVSTIIFVVVFPPLLAGILFHLMNLFLPNAKTWFILLIGLLTFLGVWASLHVQRSDNPDWNTEFSWLLGGIVIISGLFSVLFIPWLAQKENGVI
ncbi:MAG: hypothetical protein JSU05_01420 [Bacteroidetes bacterium]|nr:hypothetical protein [Bacteroidota bacterium]